MAVPKWAVASLMDDPPELIVSFATYHSWAGASEIHIYLDREDAVLSALLGGLANVEVTVCDGAFWATIGRIRPAHFEARQIEIANHAASVSQADYLIHLGASEFVHQTTPVEAALSELPEGTALMVPNVERVDIEEAERDEIFSTEFRIPSDTIEAYDLTLDETGLTRFGLAGHAFGRTLTPLRFGYYLGAHRPQFAQSPADTYPAIQRAHGIRILHFDGMTPLDWIYKRLRDSSEQISRPHQSVEPQVSAQFQAVSDDPRGTYDRLKQINAGQMAMLTGAGLIESIEFDPRRAIDALVPLDPIDLSCARFDDWIKQEKAAFLAEHRFSLDH